MIDTHLHILPGIDDGPDTLEEALELAEALTREGVHSAIATPHYNDEYPRRSATEIQYRVQDLQYALGRSAIPLRLFAGHEALIKPGMVEDIQTGRLATLNGGRYLLLELWPNTWLPETDRVIFELRAAGIIPVLAHAERYRAIQHDPNRLVALMNQGVLTQVTASSFCGFFGKTARRSAETLLKKGLVHCIASDAHGLRKRPPGIQAGLQSVAKLLEKASILQMIEAYPTAILNNMLCR